MFGKAVSYRNEAIIAFVVLLGVALCCYLGFRILTGGEQVRERSFDSQVWKRGTARIRGSMVADLIASKRIEGLRREEMISLLGTPDNDSAFLVSYRVDVGTRMMSEPWLYDLYIEFDRNDKAATVEPRD